MEPHQFLCPSPLEHRDDDAVGGGDRDQVHECGLQGHEDRSENHHEKNEGTEDDRTDDIGQILHNEVSEVDERCGRATDVRLDIGSSSLLVDRLSEIGNE